jgi:hypothetical protein
MPPNGGRRETQVSLAAPDPTWRKVSCWPGGATTYVIWDAIDENESVPPAVRATIAAALCDLGLVVFLGGPGWSISNDWRQVDGGWTGVSKRRLLDWFLRKPSLRFMASREARIVETLFDQQGFDWNLRGQVAFVLKGDDTIMCAKGCPDRFAACLVSDPPQRVPQSCIAILRPGTDGDFDEFHDM